MARNIRYSICYNNVSKCSGLCSYCLAATNNNYILGANTKTEEAIINSVKATDEINYKTFKYDWDRLADTLDHDPRMQDNITFDIWGADPVTNFKCLKDTVSFLQDYCKTRNKKYRISSSTNGLPLLRDEVADYLRENKITVQLSHDGLGQYIRTRDFDPLNHPKIRQLLHDGVITAINATLSFYNYSLFENMKYFNSILKEVFPKVWSNEETATPKESATYRNLYIKLNHIMDGEYNITAINPDTGLPYGDISLHNDKALAEATGNYDYAHVLDNYLYEWDVYLEMDRFKKTNTLKFMPFNKYLRSQFTRGKALASFNSLGNNCRNFQIGLVDYSEHLDTTGRYSQCNLSDADHDVANKSNNRVDYCEECKTCKYKLSTECNMCGGVKPRSKCEYYYRWNQFLDKARGIYGKPNINTRKKSNS